MHRMGFQNIDRAVDLARRAKDQGNIANKSWVYYASGFGISQDYAKARELFESSAKAGDGIAQFFLGRLYLSGLGVEEDKNAQ